MSPSLRSAYLGLGTNLGDRASNLRRAIAALREIGTVDAVSHVYESDAVGYTDQPRFWNMAVTLVTDLAPPDLLETVKQLETALGRTTTFAMGPRLIDIDVLLVGDVVLETPELVLPHPRLLERAFVLRPLLDLDAGLRHPATGERLTDRIAADRGDASLVRVAGAADILRSTR